MPGFFRAKPELLASYSLRSNRVLLRGATETTVTEVVRLLAKVYRQEIRSSDADQISLVRIITEEDLTSRTVVLEIKD